jgi:nucleoid DNA-binding protein
MVRLELKEFIEKFSKKSKIDDKSVRKVTLALVAAVSELIEKDDRVVIPRLGVFLRRPGRRRAPATSYSSRRSSRQRKTNNEDMTQVP